MRRLVRTFVRFTPTHVGQMEGADAFLVEFDRFTPTHVGRICRRHKEPHLHTVHPHARGADG
jgi:hypothetical protein